MTTVGGAVLGVDVGTTGAKAVVVGADGSLLATGRASYAMDVPQPGWAEQHPDSWWKGVREAVGIAMSSKRVDEAGIAGVGFTGQMHGSVFLDDRGAPIRPALLWCDQRTAEQVREIEERLGGADRVLDATGNPALTGFTAPKVLWLRKREPDAYRSFRHLLLPKDYVLYRATGERSTDVTDASGTSLFDVAARKWSENVLTALDIDSAVLPAVHESQEVVGAITPAAAEALGLAVGTPVVAGAGDQAAGGVGTGAIAEGRISLSIGTSGVAFTAASEPLIHPSGALHCFCHAVPKTWHLMGVTLAAGGSMQWAAELLAAGDLVSASALAEGVPAGSEGLIFLPYMSGERTPHANPDARGVFFGLSYVHGAAHMLRSVMEGVAFSLADCLALFGDVGISADEVVISGGGAHSEVWRRIIASVIGQPVTRVMPEEGPATGAAILAGVGAGVWSTVREATRAVVRLGGTTEPSPGWAQTYPEIHSFYRDLYEATKDLFPRLRNTS